MPDDAFMVLILDAQAMEGVSGVARHRDEFGEAVQIGMISSLRCLRHAGMTNASRRVGLDETRKLRNAIDKPPA